MKIAFALVVCAARLSGPTASQTLHVAVEPMDTAARATPMTLVAVKASPGGIPSERLSATVVDGKATLHVGSGTWLVSASGNGLWSPVRSIEVQTPAANVRLEARIPVWQVGKLVGRLAAPFPGAPLIVAFDAPASPDGHPQWKESSTCAVNPGHEFTCEVPEGVRDLQLRSEGFVPRYLWDVPIPAGGILQAPAMRLSTGASIAGFVERPTRVDGPMTVKLHTLDLESIDNTSAGRFSAPVTGRHGFFQLINVPPGEYLIQARLNDLVSGAQPVAVRLNSEAWLRDPLTVSPPLTLNLVVAPAIPPAGGRWLATLARRDGRMRTPVAANVKIGEDGTWHRDELPAGMYEVGLSDETGGRWAVHEVTLAGSEPVFVNVEQRFVRGTVRLGRKPLEAQLTFKGGLAKVALSSNDRGEFAGELPAGAAPGEPWVVVVVSSKPPLRRTVSVPISASSAENVVEVNLPDTTLEVRLYGEDGKPWNKKTILTAVTDKDGPQQVLVLASDSEASEGDAAGASYFRGLSPGSVHLAAKSSSARSADVLASVSEDKSARVDLVMYAAMVVPGRVVSEDGTPVAGARLIGMPNLAPFQGMENEHSDGEGRFELRFPRGTSAIGLSAFSGGFAYQMSSREVRDGESLTLVLGRSGGTLRLSLPPSVTLGKSGQIPFLLHRGHMLNAMYLRQWAELNGADQPGPETLVVPQMEAGTYALCIQELEQIPLLLQAKTPAESCASGDLVAGSELELAPPASRRPSKDRSVQGAAPGHWRLLRDAPASPHLCRRRLGRSQELRRECSRPRHDGQAAYRGGPPALPDRAGPHTEGAREFRTAVQLDPTRPVGWPPTSWARP